jgi:hypothetical protein
LISAILLGQFLRWQSSDSCGEHPKALYAALLIAPLVQYGLVLVAVPIVCIMALTAVGEEKRLRWREAALAGASVGLGSLSSFFLTVRYQFSGQQSHAYLAASYFDPRATGLAHFLLYNTYSLVRFLLPGRFFGWCAVASLVVALVQTARGRSWEPVTVLMLASVTMVAGAAVIGLYPFGGVRQCLFLAPILALFVGAFLSNGGNRWGPSRVGLDLLVVAVIVVFGLRDLRAAAPYSEVEDTKTVLAEFAKASKPSDRVYTYWGAVPAVEFYLRGKDPRFVYGKNHRGSPALYGPEFDASIASDAERVWLMFAHATVKDEVQLVEFLSHKWSVERVVQARGASLYLAQRTPLLE